MQFSMMVRRQVSTFLALVIFSMAVVTHCAQAADDWFNLFGDVISTQEGALEYADSFSGDYFTHLFKAQGRTELQMVRVSSDASPGFSDLKVGLGDDYRVETLIYYVDSKTRNEFTADALKKGVVMLKSQGRDILILKSEKFDASHGGVVTLDYLYNGVTGARGQFKMELLRSGDQWNLWVNDQAGRRIFTTMFLKSKSQWPVGVVGIDHVEVK